jgi:bifunctional ADP-heptose synthase (sugar kinase/adenylyltransferase)
VLVVGDAMLDRYWFGAVERISPEAPVPVVRVNREEERLGGAANVALQRQDAGRPGHAADGGRQRRAGRKLQRLLEQQGVSDRARPRPAALHHRQAARDRPLRSS